MLLTVAGWLDFAAAVTHFAIIAGGPAWYRFFGAGEQMAQMAAKKQWRPVIITTAIALMLLIWALYCWSAAGFLPPLPWLLPVLAAITVIYSLRGVAGFLLLLIPQHPLVRQNSSRFWLVSSLICLLFAGVHGAGLYRLC